MMSAQFTVHNNILLAADGYKNNAGWSLLSFSLCLLSSLCHSWHQLWFIYSVCALQFSLSGFIVKPKRKRSEESTYRQLNVRAKEMQRLLFGTIYFQQQMSSSLFISSLDHSSHLMMVQSMVWIATCNECLHGQTKKEVDL